MSTLAIFQKKCDYVSPKIYKGPLKIKERAWTSLKVQIARPLQPYSFSGNNGKSAVKTQRDWISP